MPVRPANSHERVDAPPLDPDAVMILGLELAPWLGGETIQNATVEVPAALVVGDGTTPISTPSGDVVPPGVSISGTTVIFAVAASPTMPPKPGSEQWATVHYRTPTRADDLTWSIPVRER